MIAMVLLVFAAIALFVSVLVIANTFTILFAQRTRDFALLRCVGATRRQVLRSIRVEALSLGVAASVLGLLVGTALGHGLVALARSLMPPRTMGTPDPSLLWYAVAFAVGLLVTLVAAWLPTRRVVRVSPLAALRPDDRRGRADDRRSPAHGDWTGPGRGRSGAAGRVDRRALGGGDDRRRGVSLHRRAPAGTDPHPRADPDRRPGLRSPARPGRAARGGQRRPQPAAYGHHDGVPAGRRHPDHGGADRAGQRPRRGRGRHGRLAPGGRDPDLDRRPAAGTACCPTCAPCPALPRPSSSTG